MKLFLVLCSAASFATIHIAVGEPKTAQITFRDHPRFDLSVLSAAERRHLEELKTGMTRKQLEAHFNADGGLIVPFAERYYLRDTRPPHRQNKVVMVDIAFKPAAMDEATFSDPQLREAWIRTHNWYPGDPNDIVKAFSNAYESGIAID